MLETIKGRVAHRRKSDEGFTLIELLVVIVILAILAAIVVFAVGGIGDKGQESACDADLKTIQVAEEAYFAAAPSPGVYTDEANLVTEQFLGQQSTLHDVNLGPGNASYSIGLQTGSTCPADSVYPAP